MLDHEATRLGDSFLGKPAVPTSMFEFFISSGTDVWQQRDQFESLVKVFDESFARNSVPGGALMALRTKRWEDLSARRYVGNPNDRFVAAAQSAHVTVALLSSVVRKGTREEIEGVLSTPSTQLAVIVMPKEGKPLEDGLAEFLEANSRRFHYVNTREPPDHFTAVKAMVGIISSAVADALNPEMTPEPFSEQR